MFLTKKWMFSVILARRKALMKLEVVAGQIALAGTLEAARSYAERSLSESTRRAMLAIRPRFGHEPKRELLV